MNNFRFLLASLAFIFIISGLSAKEPLPNPEAFVSFSFVSPGGKNATSVAWNAKKKLYYTVIAGNVSFPLEVFDESGKPLMQMEVSNDLRGLFWMKKGNRLVGNCVSDKGWVDYELTSKGMPTLNISRLTAGMHQPGYQSVATYYPKKKKLSFYENGWIHFYSLSTFEFTNKLKLRIPVQEADLNSKTVGYTGEKGYEWVLFDHVRRKLYFFDRDGEFTAESQLPMHAPASQTFRFSFTNGMAFLFNAQARKWIGYKVF